MGIGFRTNLTPSGKAVKLTRVTILAVPGFYGTVKPDALCALGGTPHRPATAGLVRGYTRSIFLSFAIPIMNIIGHERIRELLARHAREGRQTHAYLFVGPDAVGKRVVARAFAQILLCESMTATGGACGRCASCRQPAAAHPDLVVLRGETDGDRIGIEAVRGFTDRLALRPFGRTRNVAIIEDAHRLTLEAANALLKLVEEPRGETMVILTTANPTALPSTLRSRCLTLTFSPVPLEVVARALRQRGVSAGQANQLARRSEGRPGIAIDLLDPDRRNAEGQRVALAIDLLRMAPIDRFLTVEQLIGGTRQAGDGRMRAREFLRELRSVLRQLLLRLQGLSDLVAMRSATFPLTAKDEPALREALRANEWALAALEANAQPRLALDVACISLPLLPR